MVSKTDISYFKPDNVVWYTISATKILCLPSKGSKSGSFIGYSSTGLPLYSFTGDAISKTSQSVALVLKNGLKQIYEESDSRKIFYFLCINLVSQWLLCRCLFHLKILQNVVSLFKWYKVICGLLIWFLLMWDLNSIHNRFVLKHHWK